MPAAILRSTRQSRARGIDTQTSVLLAMLQSPPTAVLHAGPLLHGGKSWRCCSSAISTATTSTSAQRWCSTGPCPPKREGPLARELWPQRRPNRKPTRRPWLLPCKSMWRSGSVQKQQLHAQWSTLDTVASSSSKRRGMPGLMCRRWSVRRRSCSSPSPHRLRSQRRLMSPQRPRQSTSCTWRTISGHSWTITSPPRCARERDQLLGPTGNSSVCSHVVSRVLT